MNTTEHLVEIFYRNMGCFTATDVKIINGNNRQFDLLAFNVRNCSYYHVEVSVAHGQHWQPNLSKLTERVRYKFFGTTRNLRPTNQNTDHAKGKSYLQAIKDTYAKYGMQYDKIIRVWCTWLLSDEQNEIDQWKCIMASEYGLQPSNFEFLNFRDQVLHELINTVGTAYYEDELLRTISLMKAYDAQRSGK